jgi:hypothetical protein
MWDSPVPRSPSNIVLKQKPKGMKPLLTCEPLPDDREKKPAAQPAKKRKRVIPATPALSFDPKRNHVPSGRQEPPVPSPIFPRPSASESPTISYDEQRTTYFADREIQDPFYNGYDAQKRSRICSEYSSTEYSTSAYSDTPSTDVNDTSSALPDFYDSPASHTSSSSPAPSDPSPCTAECTVHVIDGQPMYSYSPVYVQQPVLYQDPYSYPMGPCPDRHAQGNPVQYSDPAYSRPVPHGIPAYPENTSYAYRRY